MATRTSATLTPSAKASGSEGEAGRSADLAWKHTRSHEQSDSCRLMATSSSVAVACSDYPSERRIAHRHSVCPFLFLIVVVVNGQAEGRER